MESAGARRLPRLSCALPAAWVAGAPMSELEAAEEAADAAASEARREIRKQRKAEFDTGVQDRVGKLKEKLHVS